MYRKITEKEFYGFAEKPVVLIKFGATWCGPCKMADKILEQIGAEHHDAEIVSVDVDENPALASALNITTIPFAVRMENGKIIEQIHGLQTKAKYMQMAGIVD